MDETSHRAMETTPVHKDDDVLHSLLPAARGQVLSPPAPPTPPARGTESNKRRKPGNPLVIVPGPGPGPMIINHAGHMHQHLQPQHPPPQHGARQHTLAHQAGLSSHPPVKVGKLDQAGAQDRYKRAAKYVNDVPNHIRRSFQFKTDGNETHERLLSNVPLHLRDQLRLHRKRIIDLVFVADASCAVSKERVFKPIMQGFTPPVYRLKLHKLNMQGMNTVTKRNMIHGLRPVSREEWTQPRVPGGDSRLSQALALVRVVQDSVREETSRLPDVTESKGAMGKEPTFSKFWLPHVCSRRSAVLSMRGAVASSQPLASEIGLRILHAGGNCVDACVAIAAALNVTEPCSTGIGGDCFALHYSSSTGKVSGLNGSGRSPGALSLNKVCGTFRGGKMDERSIHCNTVPGAVAGWVDAVDRWGSLPMHVILQPAIDLAEQGFPVSSITAHHWGEGEKLLKAAQQALHQASHPMLPGGGAPVAGQVVKNPELGKTLRQVAKEGKDGFYKGRVATAIVNAHLTLGGTMTLQDLNGHTSTFPDPIHTRFMGIDVWEIPPNGQGLTALLALNILKGLNAGQYEHNSGPYLHVLIECMRLAFADTRWYIADADVVHVPVAQLLSEKYANIRRKLFDPTKASVDVKKGCPVSSSDTVSFCAVDSKGDACSFINSNYAGFGTGLAPTGCGFTLQNRGANFSLEPQHPNVLAPGKRPYHTIIPGMTTKGKQFHSAFSVMGGFMQPQGHVQVMCNQLLFGMNPQEALDAPRFCIGDGKANGKVHLEAGIPLKSQRYLSSLGHTVDLVSGHKRAVFGRGQIIRKAENGVLWSGTDCRADGVAVGY